ncbi:hypothetical protein K469DRAFT_480989, partial [Zopfia rhizophila CBS 207.26]
FFNDQTFSDITIRQIREDKAKEYKAHRVALCSMSGWFLRVARKDVIEVHDDDPNVFEFMLQYIYSQMYD